MRIWKCYILLLYLFLPFVLNDTACQSVNCHQAQTWFTFYHGDVDDFLGGADGVRADTQVRAGVWDLHVWDDQRAVVSAIHSSLVRYRKKQIHSNTRNITLVSLCHIYLLTDLFIFYCEQFRMFGSESYLVSPDRVYKHSQDTLIHWLVW